MKGLTSHTFAQLDLQFIVDCGNNAYNMVGNSKGSSRSQVTFSPEFGAVGLAELPYRDKPLLLLDIAHRQLIEAAGSRGSSQRYNQIKNFIGFLKHHPTSQPSSAQRGDNREYLYAWYRPAVLDQPPNTLIVATTFDSAVGEQRWFMNQYDGPHQRHWTEADQQAYQLAVKSAPEISESRVFEYLLTELM